MVSNPQNTAKVKENLRLPRTGLLEHISAPGIKRLNGIRESEELEALELERIIKGNLATC